MQSISILHDKATAIASIDECLAVVVVAVVVVVVVVVVGPHRSLFNPFLP